MCCSTEKQVAQSHIGSKLKVVQPESAAYHCRREYLCVDFARRKVFGITMLSVCSEFVSGGLSVYRL